VQEVKASSVQKTKEVFRKWDAKGDGLITKEALRSILAVVSRDTTEADLLAMLDYATDENGNVRYSEFVEWLWGGEYPATSKTAPKEEDTGRLPSLLPDMAVGRDPGLDWHFLDDAVARGDPEQLRPALEAAEQAAEARLNKAREALAFLEAVPEELARVEPMGDILLLRDAIVTAEKAAGGSTAQTTASKQRLELLEDTLGTCGDKDITSIKAATEWASSQLAEAMSTGVNESECMRVRQALCLLRLKAVTAGAAEEPNDIEGAIRVCGFCGVEEKDMEEARACLVAVKRKDIKAAATSCRLAGLQEKDIVEAGRHLLFVKSIAK
jgi:hypothetical protein